MRQLELFCARILKTMHRIQAEGPPPLTKETASPLYRQVKDFIIRQIRAGAWKSESRIPSENEIVSTLGVSRMTAHRALRELTEEGYLFRVQGVGTFVAPRKPESALLEIGSISEEISQRGGIHSSEVHLLREEKASREIAAAMDLRVGAKVFHSLIVHRENGLPIQLSDRYVNPSLAPEYLQQDFTRFTPNQYLMKIVPLTEAEHVIEAQLPDLKIQTLLEIRPSEPCLVLYRRTWSSHAVATRSRFVHPGSRHRLRGRFKPSANAIFLTA